MFAFTSSVLTISPCGPAEAGTKRTPPFSSRMSGEFANASWLKSGTAFVSTGRSSPRAVSGVISSAQTSTTSAWKPPDSFAAAALSELKVALLTSRSGFACLNGSSISSLTVSE